MGPIDLVFDAMLPPNDNDFGDRRCRIEIKQGPQRTIELLPEDPLYWGRLVALLSQVERLLMIFDGRFIPLCDMRFSGAANADLSAESDCAAARTHAMKQRLSYFQTANWMLRNARLVDIRYVPMSELFATWQELLDELEIVNQIYLYAISDNGMPRDVSLAFVVEMAESLVELLKVKGCCSDFEQCGKTLVNCLSALIRNYGNVIFEREREEGKLEALVRRLKNARVQVMHIKRNWENGKRLDGAHCVLYINKLSLLYRVILFDLLGVDKSTYEKELEAIAGRLDSWAEQIEGRI